MKIKLKNEWGNPFNLNTFTKLYAAFDYEDGRIFEKQIEKIISAEDGIAEIELSDFEIQGLPIGLNQTFHVVGKDQRNDEEMVFRFEKAFGVEQYGERKALV